jgi:hypothetical protein
MQELRACMGVNAKANACVAVTLNVFIRGAVVCAAVVSKITHSLRERRNLLSDFYSAMCMIRTAQNNHITTERACSISGNSHCDVQQACSRRPPTRGSGQQSFDGPAPAANLLNIALMFSISPSPDAPWPCGIARQCALHRDDENRAPPTGHRP